MNAATGTGIQIRALPAVLELVTPDVQADSFTDALTSGQVKADVRLRY